MKKKIWMFVLLAILNIIVIASFFYLTKKIRTDDSLQVYPAQQ